MPATRMQGFRKMLFTRLPNMAVSNWPLPAHPHSFCIALLVFIFPYFPCNYASDDFDHASRTVQTSFGTVNGRLVHLDVPGLGPVVEYLGVPYAMPPLGRKRFMPPNSASKWSTAKDCTKLPPVCIQKFPKAFLAGESEALKWMPESYYRYLLRVQSFVQNEAEDCLYLNLYVPERRGNRAGASLPVLVLVHGGSYSWGSGNAYNGSILASYGQMIVVTLNYRLGIFGFLSAGYQAPTCRGNWALGDIAAALEFLRQTITDFGGDSRMITLLGWDTGAALVNLLMSSPVSAPAHSRSFQRAILLGGSALSSWATVFNPTDAFFFVAEAIGCVVLSKNAKSGRRRSEMVPESSVHDITNCYMAASLDNITRAIRDIEPPTYLNVFGPAIDGSIVANDPQHNLRQHGDLFRELDLLVGVTKNEAFHLLGKQELTFGMDREKRDAIYRTLVQNLFRYHRNEILAAITDEYTDWRKPILQNEDIRTAVLKVLGDGLYLAPVINAARIHARPKRPLDSEDASGSYGRGASQTAFTGSSSSKHGTTFMYIFSHETKGFDRSRLSDAVHGEDLPYILGYPLMPKTASASLFNYSFGRTERELSEAMMRYISNFVRTGDPGRPLPIRGQSDVAGVLDTLSQLVWPPFVADVRESYVELGERPRDGAFYRAHEIAFWTKFLPSLERAGETASNEKHHQFPNKSAYYGHVRSMDRFAPFWQTTTAPSTTTMASTAPLEKTTPNSQTALVSTPLSASGPLIQDRYSTILSVTVAVGCALLILNILIFAGIYHQWDKQKRFRKRLNNQHQNQPCQQPHASRLDLAIGVPVPAANATVLNSTMSSSTAGSHASLDRNRTVSYNLASPVGPVPNIGSRVPPPPPPPAPVSSSAGPMTPNSIDSDLHPSFRQNHARNSIRHQPIQPHIPPVQTQIPLPPLSAMTDPPGTPRGLYSEQEPLLNRAFISPTCPRHGKLVSSGSPAVAAAAMAAAMDEIQV